jgi:flavin reductase (DIM6/NTAB) family NADH-FMN oxidoreductase RutF
MDAIVSKIVNDMHSYEPKNGHGLKHDPFNAMIAPRPIGWMSSMGAKGNLNLAPYSFFNAFNYKPPILGFSSNGWKDTVRNIKETGEFVWNLCSMPLAEAMNISSADMPPEVSEFDQAGLTPVPSSVVKVPRVGEARAAMELKLIRIIQLETKEGALLENWMILGEVVAVHIDKSLIQDGVYITGLAHPVARAGRKGDDFEIKPENMFDMPRPDGRP